jgi:2-polyprenyl-6-hydroxyphenyl methylase/3-demethylubiquinone-9 3-methyltransferase
MEIFWWQPDTVLHLLKTSINPWRVGYSTGVLKKLGLDPKGKTALEVGSGGGILTEDICKMGFSTTGIDPAENSINTAKNHAKASGLDIKYDKGIGEQLPYADHSFDCVFCCDVLEHISDLPKVISEISRSLNQTAFSSMTHSTGLLSASWSRVNGHLRTWDKTSGW